MRYRELDFVRGLAVSNMIIFHGLYDLKYFLGMFSNLSPAFFDWYSTLIGGTFLAVLGASAVLRRQRPYAQPTLERRFFPQSPLVRVTGAAALITLVSFKTTPNAPIFFGILHLMALSLAVMPMALRAGKYCIWMGVVFLALPLVHTSDDLFLRWLGFGEAPMRMSDFYAIFPWQGFVWLGVGGTFVWQSRQLRAGFSEKLLQSKFGKSQILFGNHALAIYLIHQPVLLGLIWCFKKLTATLVQ